MDWKDILGQLRDDPGLPPGDEQQQEVCKVCDSKKQGRLHIAIEKKGRNGKVATIIYGFECSDEELSEIAGRLKKKLGVGGSSRGGEILIQGNLAEKVKEVLIKEGYKI